MPTMAQVLEGELAQLAHHNSVDASQLLQNLQPQACNTTTL